METINMISGGDIYQLFYYDIKFVFNNHSGDARMKGRASQGLMSSSPYTKSIKNEIGNMLEDLKTEMLYVFSLQMDTMQIKRNWEEAKRALDIFCLICTKRYPRNECPLNVIEVCLFFEENHATKKFPSLPRLKVVYQGAEGWQVQPWYSSTHPSWSTLASWPYAPPYPP